MRPWLPLALVSALIPLGVDAEPARIEPTTIEHTALGPASDQELADHWDLTLPEVQRYQTFMTVERRYFYSHLDPVMVLGLIETDPTQRARYAEKYLLAERHRIAQQTGFAQLVASVQLRRFGLEAPVDFSKLPQAANAPDYWAARAQRDGSDATVARTSDPATPPTPPPTPQAGDAVDLLITPTCHAPCHAKLSALLALPGVRVRVYGRGFTDPHALTTWLAQWPGAGLDPAAKAAATARIEPRRYDPVIFDGYALTPPLALLRRQGVVIGTL